MASPQTYRNTVYFVWLLVLLFDTRLCTNDCLDIGEWLLWELMEFFAHETLRVSTDFIFYYHWSLFLCCALRVNGLVGVDGWRQPTKAEIRRRDAQYTINKWLVNKYFLAQRLSASAARCLCPRRFGSESSLALLRAIQPLSHASLPHRTFDTSCLSINRPT